MAKKLITVLGVTGTQVCLTHSKALRRVQAPIPNIRSREAPLPTASSPTPTGESAD